MLKVNLGCGTTTVAGWINIDSSLNITLSKFPFFKKILFKLHLIPKSVYDSYFPRDVIRHDVTKGLPFESDSIDYFYSSHLLEHLKRNDAKKLITECYRTLKKEGIVRVVVPDLKSLAINYVNGIINADQFIQSLKLCEFEKKKGITEKLFPTFFLKDVHKWMFDFESLRDLLLASGFEKVEKRSYQQGIVPDIGVLDNRPENSLYIEAQK